MNADKSRYQMHRQIDWSQAVKGDVAMMIKQFISRRETTRRRDIFKLFASTPEEFIESKINEAIERELIRPCRNGLSQRAGYVYEEVK